MRIGGISTLEAVHCKREASVLEAALLMRQHHVGDLIVVDEVDGSLMPVGILTDRDIVVSITAEGLDSKSIEVGDIMSTELLSTSEDADVHETIEQMRVKGVRRLPVINSSGTLVGVVSVDDLMEFLAEEMTELSRISLRQQSIEKQVRK
ncbi:CBS domain-containing protein [Herminiimonas sp. CN]|uniref:CBS domain-containing protein n=1 Tax=Herminiimonas sp. CN TaxID=1349818 RepID=UPI0004736AFB|nr:CBS domain-containing protein [Herminiimonas sp. CN]